VNTLSDLRDKALVCWFPKPIVHSSTFAEVQTTPLGNALRRLEISNTAAP
jgi:hypothetical protein